MCGRGAALRSCLLIQTLRRQFAALSMPARKSTWLVQMRKQKPRICGAFCELLVLEN
jgi:hypothetical protein